jgi:hypothetical protein
MSNNSGYNPNGFNARLNQDVSQFEVNGDKQGSNGDSMMNLCRIVGEAYRLVCRFHCKEAKEIFEEKLTKR